MQKSAYPLSYGNQKDFGKVKIVKIKINTHFYVLRAGCGA